MLLSSGQPGDFIVYYQPELDTPERLCTIGRARLACSNEIIAGASIDVTFGLTLGKGGLPIGGRIAIAWCWLLNFGDLQVVTDPVAENHLAVALDAPGATLGVLAIDPLANSTRGTMPSS